MSGVKRKSWEEMYWDSMHKNDGLNSALKSKDYRIKKLLEYLGNTMKRVPFDELFWLNEERDCLANLEAKDE